MSRIPIITRNLLIINILAFLATVALGKTGGPNSDYYLNSILGLHFCMASDFHIYQLITYMFMHGGWQHIFFNMFALWMFGCVIENVMGPKRFLFYYILCGVGAGLFQEAAQFIHYMTLEHVTTAMTSTGLITGNFVIENGGAIDINDWTTVGASGSIYAILLAFGMIFPEQRIFIFPLPVPIKAKWFVMFYAAIELFSALSTTNDGVAHIAHLGGMVFGFFLLTYWKKHPTIGYGASRGNQFFDNLKAKWERKNSHKSSTTGNFTYTTTAHSADWEYNSRKAADQKEIDAILDKIRKSGYDSLTKEEKQKLFDQSRNTRQ